MLNKNTINRKILHIQKVSGISGSENHLLTLLPLLKDYGYNLEMIVLNHKNKPSDSPDLFVEKMTEKGIKVEVFKMNNKHFNPDLIPRLINKINQEKYDIVHTHLIHADLYGMIAAKMAGVKVIVSTRHNDNLFRRQFPWNLLINFNTKLADNLICISESLKQFTIKYEGTPKDKISVIYYGFNPQNKQFDSSWKKQFNWDEETKIIGIVARLIEQKGHSTLLKAMSQILPQFPNTKLVIIGDGILRQSLEEYSEKLGINSQVNFLGYHQNAAEMMGGFDIFIHPSRWEGFGLVFLEAMAAKLPIIATNVSAIPEIVEQEKTGLLVPKDDDIALANAICQLLSNPDLAKNMGENGRKRLEKYFTVDVMAQKTANLYDQLLNKVNLKIN
jgi:glycosyltransferase involved in cell wall biosynthesis